MGLIEIFDQLESIEMTIEEASQASGGEAAARLFIVYREVLLYLLENDKLEVTCCREQFWDYVEKYTPGALYRVASYQRRKHGQPALGYMQPVFHTEADTLNDHNVRNNRFES